MGVVFTARLRVRDWRLLRQLSDERLILYARAAGARRYGLFRDTHDAAEALLLVEAASAEALRPLRDALLREAAAQRGGLTTEVMAGQTEGRLWEATACRSIEAVPPGEEVGPL